MEEIRERKDYSQIILPRGESIIVDNIKKNKWKLVDKPGEFFQIPKKDLFIDIDYQRTKINEMRINAFAANWSWVKCGVLTISIRNNQWFIVDGQHRKLAADKRSDITTLPCMLYELNSVPNEAMAFVDINTSKTTVGAFDKFKAMILGGDPIAIELNNLFKKYGYKASHNTGVKNIACLMTAWRLFKKDSKLFNKIWPAITEINQDSNITNEILTAVFYTEKHANKYKLTIIENPIKTYLVKAGGRLINAEIRKEIQIIGKGGARILSNALIKLILKQRSLKMKKIPLIE